MPMTFISKDWIIWESVNQKGKKKSRKKDIDEMYYSPLFMMLFVLTICGLLLTASSSSYVAENDFNNPLHYLKQQSIAVMMAIVMGYVMIRIPVRFWEKIGPGLLLLGTVSLGLVFVINEGEINGSYRWIRYKAINFQPSEFVKIAVIIYLAGYLIRHKEVVQKHIGAFIRPIILVSAIATLILLEPDLSGTLILLAIAIVMMFLGGVNILQFILFSIAATSILAISAFLSSYRWARITALNENIMESVHTYDSNYQILQSLVAFGQGQFLGLGFGASRQKMLYLPEAHTDFIFSIVAEELGVVGVIALILLFCLFIRHILKIAKRALGCRQGFSAYYAYGYAVLVSLHAFIHVAVTMRLLPTTGITLPFISYGGSSFLAFSIGAIILLRIEFELCPEPKPIREGRTRMSI